LNLATTTWKANKDSEHSAKLLNYTKAAKDYKIGHTNIVEAAKRIASSTNREQYDAAIKNWNIVSASFKSKGCLPPIPPMPIVLRPKPTIIDECHEGYMIGYQIGEGLGDLVHTVHGNEKMMLEQNKCLENYSYFKRIKDSSSKVVADCFDKGRRESIQNQMDL